MSQIKINIIEDKDKNFFKFDVRKNDLRTRKSIACSKKMAELIKMNLLFVDRFEHLFDVEDNYVQRELQDKLYKFYKVDTSENRNIVDESIEQLIVILGSLNKKKKELNNCPAIKFLNENKIDKNMIKVLLLGQFGSGKSTIIKELSDIDDQVDFPVVDTARTTVHNTHYIFKRNTESNFKIFVDFKSEKEKKNLISDGYYRAADKVFNGIINKYDYDRIRDIAMEEFVNDPNQIFKIEYILGKYYKKNNGKRNESEKKEQVTFWDSEFDKILKICETYIASLKLDLEESALKKHIYDDFIKENYIIDQINECTNRLIGLLNSKINDICSKQESNGYGEIIRSENHTIIGFKCEGYNVANIEEYIRPFSSTSIKYFKEILTPLVDTIVIEIPYNSSLSKEITERKICITDTIGFEHRKTDDSNSLEGSTNYQYNDFDIVGVVDKATSSMAGTTENILRELYHNANKSKIMMFYTFYDEFTKKDFEDEDDKVDFLKELQKTTIKKIEESESSNNFINLLNEGNSSFERTLFLGGLCKKDDKFKNCIDYILKNINLNFNSLYDFKKIEIKELKEDLLEYNYKKLVLVFNKSRNRYMIEQKKIYLQNYPHYKTTEALTKRLAQNETYFVGNSRILKPIDDFCSIVMNDIDLFLKNPKVINFHEKDTIKNHKEKVIDWFKEKVSSKIKVIAKKYFVEYRLGNWRKYYLYSGAGSDYVRRKSIIEEFEDVLPELLDYDNNFADKWIEEIESIFKKVLKDLKEEIQNN